MYITKLALLVAALRASTISAAPSPEKTSDDFDEVAVRSYDLRTAIDRMAILGHDASSVHDLFSDFAGLVDGLSEINKANVDGNVEAFDEQEQEETCRSINATRYSQAVIIRMLGDKADRIKQFPLSPSIGRLIHPYQKEITKFLDEVNSRLDNCDDKYKKRLEGAIKTARAQYAAIDPEA
ncbi:hypothetical protein LRP88_08884 [Fusarium phalaenopsidis]|nr:hypothetical protein NCS56_00155700 [Fusarium sp. Ph1]